MTTASLRILLEGLIDYAGLFPPAALPMPEAVRNYDRYRTSDLSWMLGRFVVPAEKAGEVPESFPLSILGMPSPPRHPERSEGSRHSGDPSPSSRLGMTPEVFEVKAANEADVDRIAAAANGATVFVEITDLALLEPIARHGLLAKIRTGGVTTEAFPAIERVAEFVRACRFHGVAFKATAGLHHPLRCVKPLTYEMNAPTGTMHGFLNVFLAALFEGDEQAVLRETSPAFTFDDDGVTWRHRRASLEDLRALRRFAVSFGSCSFDEPIADLRGLGLL